MLQFKVPIEGAEVAYPKGQVWMSPQRDIVHNFHIFVRHALSYLSNETDPVIAEYYRADGSVAEIEELAKRMVGYIRECARTDIDAPNVHDAAKNSGIFDLEPRVVTLFSYALMRVMLSAFHAGYREAIKGTFTPFLFGALAEVLPVSDWKPDEEFNTSKGSGDGSE